MALLSTVMLRTRFLNSKSFENEHFRMYQLPNSKTKVLLPQEVAAVKLMVAITDEASGRRTHQFDWCERFP